MLKLSVKSNYALAAMLDIAVHREEGLSSILRISERTGISEKFLEQILASLRRSGRVFSVRGPKGGYSITKSLDEISVRDIVVSVEGEISAVECVHAKEKYCQRFKVCKTKCLWEKLSKELNESLDNISLFYIADEYKKQKNYL